MKCLVIGATGYVGSLLVPKLLASAHDVRCLVRDPAKLAGLGFAADVEIHVGDATDPTAVRAACRDADSVFYLVHSMDGPEFAERDRQTAAITAEAAAQTGVARIIYLGGLQPDGVASAHLASRREVGEVFLGSGVPTAVLQAGIVVGAGSTVFELISYLGGIWPVIPMPDQAWNVVQPIGIDDVLYYLAACLTLPADVNRTFDVGGADVVSYREMVLGHVAAVGRPRPTAVPVPVPAVAPRLAARAVGVLTSVDRHLAGPLLESMAHDLVCREDDLTGLVGEPPGGRAGYAEAVRRAVDESEASVLVSERVEDVRASSAQLWAVISGIGGETGWYTVPGVWALRGAVDRLFGGVGTRRGRPERLRAGAALDWWRIENVDPGRSLRLRAEMRLPGSVILELRAEPTGDQTCRYVQRVTFRPQGVAGRAYWYAQLPVHTFLFAVMARTIAGVASRPSLRRGA